jgi:hypothetical protein
MSTGPLDMGYEPLLALSTKKRPTEKIRKELNNLQKAFIYWCGQEHGMRLSMRVANHLAARMRQGILDGTAFMSGTPGLSKDWLKKKKKWGFPSGIGRATGQLADEIRAVPAGKGMYRVGFPRGTKRKQMYAVNPNTGKLNKIGNYETLYQVAVALERGTPTQKPRPFMLPMFISFVHSEVPQHVASTILKDLQGPLRRMEHEMNVRWNLPPADQFHLLRVEGKKITAVSRKAGVPKAAYGTVSQPLSSKIDITQHTIVTEDQVFERMPATWIDSVSGTTYRIQHGVLQYIDALGRWRGTIS